MREAYDQARAFHILGIGYLLHDWFVIQPDLCPEVVIELTRSYISRNDLSNLTLNLTQPLTTYCGHFTFNVRLTTMCARVGEFGNGAVATIRPQGPSWAMWNPHL
jgi:hypothetical protein